MEFNYKFKGESSVKSNAEAVDMSFSPDLFREPTYFSGLLNSKVPFREAISALHDIVVSDYRFKPKDKSDYKEWAKQQEDIWLAEYLKGTADVEVKLKAVQQELQEIRRQKEQILAPFNKAKINYFQYIYKHNRDAWMVLDPVITVHPDELFFECFSKDESTYGKLGCNYNVFKNLKEFKCGTTNVDYSADLYNEFQKVRDYKETHFNIDPSGFEVQTANEEAYKEVKIDVPESWVRGFLQVSSAMTLPAHVFNLHPTDLYNICFTLRRNKEKEGPRSIRFVLKPGEPVKLIFEPWNLEIKCGRSVYDGKEPAEIRIWGRRRLLLLERLIPIAKGFKVVLLGSGLPSFFVADLGDLNFTLGLSGWTANDWSQTSNFDLLAPRMEVDNITMQKVYTGLKENWSEPAPALAKRLNLDQKIVLGALSAFTQAGRVIFDIHNGTYRIRELSREALPVEKLRFANEREEEATILVEAGNVRDIQLEAKEYLKQIKASVKEKDKFYSPILLIDKDERLVKASCTCNFYTQNKLMQGPCKHILAARIAEGQKVKFDFSL